MRIARLQGRGRCDARRPASISRCNFGAPCSIARPLPSQALPHRELFSESMGVARELGWRTVCVCATRSIFAVENLARIPSRLVREAASRLRTTLPHHAVTRLAAEARSSVWVRGMGGKATEHAEAGGGRACLVVGAICGSGISIRSDRSDCEDGCGERDRPPLERHQHRGDCVRGTAQPSSEVGVPSNCADRA